VGFLVFLMDVILEEVSQERLETKTEAYPEKMEASQEKIEARTELCDWVPCIKATYLLTAL
jgi:hypothetical protein